MIVFEQFNLYLDGVDVLQKLSSGFEPFGSHCVRLEELQVFKLFMQRPFAQVCIARGFLAIGKADDSKQFDRLVV